ncbi:sorting nexin-19a isoform X2 [Melanotaenia boesemani]|nr:sorting nexin-19a isoform X2 [Melanotaenia boesemani]XP_041864962.1 sorting nexin-19a isoform X2 [Melanotaenia boesemani]XP_041864963.1 sorting nexin-19a isoform X2 [Melanotaenia boesemani]
MPPSQSSINWTLVELLGQRRMLGLGALLAWLVLFHLLVNVWLLCIFTSLLVVLGGWLGSRAALDANSLLHLEHFLPLGKVKPPLYSPEHEWRLNHEIHSAVHKAVRDFVSSWYRTLLPDVEGEFERAVRHSMLESVMELKERAQQVDRKALVQRLLELYGCHLQSYMTVRQIQSTQKERISLWQLYSEVESPHPAMRSETAELNYSRALINLVLHVLVPYPQMETRTGGYMVTELITCNVLLPLISRVSDPDWLNQTIVDIFTKSREPQEINVDDISAEALYKCETLQESWTTCKSLSSCDQAGLSSKSTSDVDDPQSQSAISGTDSSQCSRFSLMSAEKIPSCHAGLHTSYKGNCCLLPSGLYSHLSVSKIVSMDSLIQSDLEDDRTGSFCDCGPPTNFCNLLSVKDDEALGCFAPLRNLGPKVVLPEESQWPAGITQEKSPSCPRRKLCLTSYNFEASNNPASPVNVQKVQISGTVNAKEQRSTGTHPYTLYTIKFETVADGGNGDILQPAVSHSVSRRYSEFLNLQTRLEEKPDVKKLIKNVRGPKKMFPDLPFGSPDSDKVEVRKSQLDAFLKQLCSIPETANSEDMQEFLAIDSDVCTYFGRKPVSKSRIDKMMENALDTLRTAFPHPELLSPTEDMEGDTDGRIMDSRKYRRLFPSKISPSVNLLDLHPKVTYCFSEGSAILNGMPLSGLESFVREQERLLYGLNSTETAKQSCGPQAKDKRMSGKSHGTDTAVADVALNILCLLMKDQWSWLCTENIQKTIRLLFGTFIERWLDVGVAHLTSAPCWVIYLQVLQEAVWPGGTLPSQPQPERSAAERQETKEQCLDCLMQLLPELITDMLGSEKYRLSLETMLESFQDHQINKHLIFCICDLLLELLIPESCDEAFQKSLLQSLVKDTEKDSPHM